VRRVHGGQRELGRQVLQDLGLGDGEREHDAAGERLHRPAARRHQPQRVVERKDAGQHGGRVLADAVAEESGWTHAPRLPQPRQGVLHRQQRGLRRRRLTQRFVGAGRQQDGAQVAAQVREQAARAIVDRGAEDGLDAVQGGAHSGALRPLAREEEGDGGVRLRAPAERGAGGECLRQRGPQHGLGGIRGGRDEGEAVLERCAAAL
jgi:hypothetical protein